MTDDPDILTAMRAELARLEGLIANAQPQISKLRRAIAAMEAPHDKATPTGRAPAPPKPGTIARLLLDRTIAAGDSGIKMSDLTAVLESEKLTPHSTRHAYNAVRANFVRMEGKGFVCRVASGRYVATAAVRDAA